MQAEMHAQALRLYVEGVDANIVSLRHLSLTMNHWALQVRQSIDAIETAEADRRALADETAAAIIAREHARDSQRIQRLQAWAPTSSSGTHSAWRREVVDLLLAERTGSPRSSRAASTRARSKRTPALHRRSARAAPQCHPWKPGNASRPAHRGRVARRTHDRGSLEIGEEMKSRMRSFSAKRSAS